MDAMEKEAWKEAGYRERYAMKHGKKKIEKWGAFGGKEVWRYFYSTDDPYQDANGAAWFPQESRWVG